MELISYTMFPRPIWICCSKE